MEQLEGPAVVFSDPALDPWRHPPTDRCWWCGGEGNTREHKYKRSDLKLTGTVDGVFDVSNLYKWTPEREGLLQRWRRGVDVVWDAPICANCNGARSARMDESYSRLSLWIHENTGRLARDHSIGWDEVFGPSWQQDASGVARYLTKQFACQLSQNRVAIPPGVIGFLDGGPRPPTLALSAWVDKPFFEFMLAAHEDAGVHPTGHLGLPPCQIFAGRDGVASSEYRLTRECLTFQVAWYRDGEDYGSIWESPGVNLPIE